MEKGDKEELHVLKEILQSIQLASKDNTRLLDQVNLNTKASEVEVWHRSRKDLGGEKVTVHIRVNILAIGDIDSVKEQFKAELYIICKYKEPLLKGKVREEVDWGEQWDPRLVLANKVATDTTVKKHRLEYVDGDDIPWASLSLRVSGTFKENLELERFPFDYQELSVVIQSDWPEDDIELVRDMDTEDDIRLDTFTGIHEWSLCDHVIARPEEPVKEAAADPRVYPRYRVTANAVRKPAYFLWNVALIMALIMLLTFASLAVPPANVSERLSVTLTLLLTSVAFKFVVTQNLPKISYLTILDTYVIICMVVQVVMAAQNAVASLFTEPATALLFDYCCVGVVGSAVLLAHIVLVIFIAVWVRKRNVYLNTATKEYFKVRNEIARRRELEHSVITTHPPVTNIDETKRRNGKKEKKQKKKEKSTDCDSA